METLGFDTPSAVHRATGLPLSTVKAILRRDAIGPKAARVLADALQVSYKWLKTGNGPIRTDQVIPTEMSNLTPSAEHRIVTPDPWAEAIYPQSPRSGPPDEQTSVRERILALQDMLGFDGLSTLASAAGISTDQLMEIMGRDEIDDDTAYAIAHALHIQYEWLRFGKGRATKPGAEIQGYLRLETDQAEHTITDAAGRLQAPLRDRTSELVMVPMAEAKLSAGGGLIPEEGVLPEHYAFRRKWLKSVAKDPSRVILLEVEGDSMVPTLLPRDTVLIDLLRQTPQDGCIYAIAVGDVLTIKRIRLLPGPRILIISDNEGYHSYEAALDEIKLIGKLIWFGRMLA